MEVPTPASRSSALSTPGGILLALWLAGAAVTWNMVFDAHIVAGARDYVDRQELFVEGRGPRQDMERSMSAARAAGVRAAAFWSSVELAPGAALWLVVRARRRRRAGSVVQGERVIQEADELRE